MSRYTQLIKSHEIKKNELRAAIKETVKTRDRSRSDRDTWIRAADDFRSFRSPVDDWIDQIIGCDICEWQDAREFIFDYFSVDPVYFRSGYAKEMMIKKIKKCQLLENEKIILRDLIVNRIKKGGLRDFKKFCSIIPIIEDNKFKSEIRFLTEVTDKQVSVRARIAEKYLY